MLLEYVMATHLVSFVQILLFSTISQELQTKFEVLIEEKNGKKFSDNC